jgi:hypothetical protein
MGVVLSQAEERVAIPAGTSDMAGNGGEAGIDLITVEVGEFSRDGYLMWLLLPDPDELGAGADGASAAGPVFLLIDGNSM